MAKLTLAESQQIAADVGNGLGGVCNDVYDAIKSVPRGPALQTFIDRGMAKVRQYEDAVAKLSGAHQKYLKGDYEDQITGLKEDLVALEAKQKG